MAQIWIDVETAAGVKVGDGPITTATEWAYNPTLDEAGTFSFVMPAGDPRAALLTSKRIAHAYMIDSAGTITDIGSGIIDEVEANPREPTMLRVSGPDLLAELAWRAIPELTVCTQALVDLDEDDDLGLPKGAVRWLRDNYGDTSDNDLPDAYDGITDAGGETIRLWREADIYADWLYVGHDARYDFARVTLSGEYLETNRAETTLVGQYFNGSGWDDLPDLVDGTSGYIDFGDHWATMNQTGDITWTRPADWARITPTEAAGSWFWVRFTVLSGSVTDDFDIWEIQVWADVPTTDGVNQIMAYAPVTWTTSGYPATVAAKYLELSGESVLACLRALAEQGGQGVDDPREHFRLGTGRAIDWFSTFTDSGLRADNATDPDEEICLITDLQQRRDTEEVVTRLYPRSNDGVTLALTTRTAPAGYTMVEADGYIENDAGVAALGRIDAFVRFTDLTCQQSDSWWIHPALVANAVYDRGIEYLRTHCEEQCFYTLELARVRDVLLPGYTIRVVYHEYRDGYHAINVDATLYILSTRIRVDEDGLHTVGLEVATTDRKGESDMGVIRSTIQDVRRLGTSQAGIWNIVGGTEEGGDSVFEGPGIDITGGASEKTVGIGGDTILVYHRSQEPVEEFAPTSAGFDLALAACDANDFVLLPSCSIDGDHTVPASITVTAQGFSKAVLTGQITLSDVSVLNGIEIVRTADQAGDLVAIVPPASGMAYVEHCNIMAENANGAGYAAYGACDHLTLRWCYIAAESGGTDANPFGSYEETLSDAYFDCSEGGPTDPEGAWTDPGQAFDGEQVAAICYESEGVEGETYYLHGAGTTASGTGTITKVEARAEGDIVLCSWNCLRLAYTVYTASLAEELGEEPGACRDVPPTGFPEWSEWIELDEPIAGWSWALVQALEVKIWPGNAGSAGTDVTASGVWLRITSEGSAGDPITHACVIPNSDGRAMAMPEYGDRASWRTDHDDGATHADDWDAGDSHHAQSHALASEADHTDVDNEAKADGYVLVWRTAAGKHVYETKGSTIVAGEEDADPVGMYAALKFPNDSLTDNMDGSISVSFRRTGVISYAIDGGGSVITTGCHGFLPVPANCTIIEAQAVASPLGSAVIDIWADSFANFPPTDADTITGTAPITIVSAVGVDNTQFVTWTTSLTAGDWLGFNVDSVSTAVQVIVALYVEYD